MLSIGNVHLGSQLVLAPLAGITDLPLRMLCREFGCELAFSTMISARSLAWSNIKTEKMLFTEQGDRPLGIQFLGVDPEMLARAADKLAGLPYDMLDLNAACPVAKVVRKGEGACLMKEPKKIYELVKVLVERTSVPVTVKLRAGWDNASRNACEAALRAQDAGASAVFIHGRTRAQEYRGRVQYETIREVKKALSIPVIGSGDAFSPRLIKRMLDETGCDGVAIARGALGNPWLFQEANAFLAGKPEQDRPGPADILAVMRNHLDRCCSFHGEALGTKLFRKFFSWYSKGFLNIKPLRIRAFAACSCNDMMAVIDAMESLGMEPGAPVYASREADVIET
ncbi:MAG: tRNA dihydrouridine synthase DusB [Deltaproteobacteria bacterium]|nr:tRNA dihydrouridine synthase DusB [Deltaproteobacteria bacterium]